MLISLDAYELRLATSHLKTPIRIFADGFTSFGIVLYLVVDPHLVKYVYFHI